MPLLKGRRRGKSLVLKRNTRIDGLQTSVHLERAFWTALREIAAVQEITRAQLIAAIDNERRERQYKNFSSAIRLFVLEYYRSRMQP